MVKDSLPQSPLLYVTVAPADQRVEPGGESVFLITIENRSREAQTQSLQITGLPQPWYNLDFDARRRVFPNERRSATLLVRVPADASPERYAFGIIVTADGTESGVACSLEVLGREQPTVVVPPPPPVEQAPPPAPGVSLVPAEVTWRDGAPGSEKVTVNVRNVGGEETEYVLEVQGLQAGWYTIAERLTVPPRQARETELSLTPPARARQDAYAFRVVASVAEHPNVRGEASGRLTVAPREQAPREERTQGAISPVTGTGTTAPPPPQGAPVLPPDVSLTPRNNFRFGQGEVAAQASLNVQNRSRLIERYQLAVEGLPDDWYTLGMTEVRLEPGASTQIPLRLTPRTGPSFPAGEYGFRIRVAPHSFPDSFAEVGGTLSIAGVASFDARLTPVQTSGRKEKFKLTLQNTGGVSLSPWVEASDPAGMCTFKYTPPATLEVGQETVVPIWVGARRNGLAGEAKTFDFRLRVSPAGGASSSARSFDARFVHQPFLSKNLVKYGLIAMFLASLVGLFLSFGTGSVSRAATYVRCGIGDTFQETDRGPVLVKEECGGAPLSEQRGGAAPPVTTTPTAVTPTPVPDRCEGAFGLSVGQQVTLRDDARIREEPGLSGADTRVLGRGRPGTILAGPVCDDNLIWWQVDSGQVTGWTAEQSETNIQLILPR